MKVDVYLRLEDVEVAHLLTEWRIDKLQDLFVWIRQWGLLDSDGHLLEDLSGTFRVNEMGAFFEVTAHA